MNLMIDYIDVSISELRNSLVEKTLTLSSAVGLPAVGFTLNPV